MSKSNKTHRYATFYSISDGREPSAFSLTATLNADMRIYYGRSPRALDIFFTFLRIIRSIYWFTLRTFNKKTFYFVGSEEIQGLKN